MLIQSRIRIFLVLADFFFVLFLFFSFCTCSTIEHCTWAPYFTSCQSVKGSERWRGKKEVYI